MAGSREGGLKTAEKLTKLYGKDYYRDMGRKGGSVPRTTPRGFAAMNPSVAGQYGKLGGAMGIRGMIMVANNIEAGIGLYYPVGCPGHHVLLKSFKTPQGSDVEPVHATWHNMINRRVLKKAIKKLMGKHSLEFTKRGKELFESL